MFGLFCKGLHCAGCGKGLPLSIILLIVGMVAVRDPSFDSALGGAIAEATIVLASVLGGCWIVTLGIIALFVRKGPVCVYTRTDRITYSQMKYIETGDSKWLALSGPVKALAEAPNVAHNYGKGEVVLLGNSVDRN
jgi:hypothetical protein